MAVLSIPAESRRFQDPGEIRAHLASIGIEYERIECAGRVQPGASPAEVLAAFAPEIDALNARGGYVAADVIDVNPGTPGLEAMLEKFRREHWHHEDEVRLVVDGRGIFHVRPEEGLVHAIEVGPGDLIRVPRGTWHWFDLCENRSIRAVRLFQDPAGWTAHYTGSRAEEGHQPACFGPPIPSAA